MITHVLKLNYLERINDGYEEGPRFTILAGDEEAEILEKLHFTEGVTVDSDYLVAEFTATGTNGVSLRPGDLIVLSEGHSSVVISPSEDIIKVLIAKVDVPADDAV